MEKIIKCCDGKAEVRQFKGTNSNIYLISYFDENRTVMVDCGLPWDAVHIIEFIKKNNLPPVEKVICTHFHVDHCSGWIELKEILKSPLIYFHVDATPFVTGTQTMDMPAFSDFKDIMIPVMKENQYMPELKEAIKTLYYGTTFKSRFPMERVSFFNSDDIVIPGFQTIHTPGHRPESVSFYDPSSGVFISGDFIIVMNGRIVVNTFVYDSEKQMESFEKVKKLEDLMYLLPGHGEIKHFNEKLLKYKF
ncbi:MAG TPA: MBL fold metallo-hydrolase [bacterium]|nr:MBL fold metallo-hydrolase [bacterium]